MTVPTTSREPGVHAGLPALVRLVPDTARFAAEVWGREALLTRAADLPGPVGDLLDEDAVDELVSRRGLRTPFIRVAKDGTTLPTSAYTSGGGVGAGIADQVDDSRLGALFGDGATLVLQALHRTWPPLVDFTQQLAADLGHPVQVNAYVTPPQSRGFDDHYDVHDVFVLQVCGEKRWRIHRPVHPAPLRDEPWTDRREAVRAEARREPVIDAVLAPGDCLYLPRGHLHAATALGDVSTHLTFGVHTWTGHGLAEDLLGHALAALADDEQVRSSLPLGTRVEDPAAIAEHVELVRERLAAAVAAVPVEALAADLGRRARGSSRPAPLGPLARLRTAQTLTHESVLVVRAHLAPSLDAGPDGAVLVSRAGRLDLGAADAAAVEPFLAGRPVAAGTLGLDLAERLVRAGVAVPA